MNRPVRNRPPLTLRKRLLFSSFLLLLSLAFAEGSAFLAYRVLHGRWFSWTEAQARRAELAQPETTAEFVHQSANQMLHPYVGYVLDPGFQRNPNAPPITISAFGYADEKLPIQRREPGKCVVAIVGGSVAGNFFADGTQMLVQQLRQSERFADTELTVVNLAMGGYKQPQQLMTLNYLLALGGEFDIVVNLDGFNEVALHESENGLWGVFPSYPRNWPRRCESIPSESLLKALGQRGEIHEYRRRLAKRCSRPWLRYSMMSNLFWNWRDNASARALQQIDVSMRERNSSRTRFVETGPQVPPLDDGDVYDHLAGIWRRSSLQLHNLCRANGIRYYHFLQPNQYVTGTKDLNPQELAQAYDELHPYRQGVEKGYPRLVAEGQKLVREGVHFFDLTNVFAGNGDTIYRDSCCHLNELGNAILAQHVARDILADLRNDLAWRPGPSTIR